VKIPAFSDLHSIREEEIESYRETQRRKGRVRERRKATSRKGEHTNIKAHRTKWKSGERKSRNERREH
jgi:hypothetical protein